MVRHSPLTVERCVAQAVRISANGNALNVFEIYETGDTYVEAKRADLQSAINTVPELDESAYTEESWAAYEEALAHAEELMAGTELSQREGRTLPRRRSVTRSRIWSKTANSQRRIRPH